MQDRICIGTMLWGTRTSESQANEMIKLSIDNGIYFFDTAEMYPTFPYSDQTIGLSEKIIGRWIKDNGRNGMRISTKMKSPIDPKNIRQSVDKSLQRLNIENINYYQLHWPNRGSYCFRQNWAYDPTNQQTSEVIDHMDQTLYILTNLMKEGKITNIGMSNETAWGITKWNQVAKEHGYSRLRFVQNEYSLLCRLFDLDMFEACHHEDIKLLAWTPLAGGLLTGKYELDTTPERSRRSYKALGSRDNENVWSAIDGYKKVAIDHDLDLIHMSLSWILTRPFVWSVIVGATTPDQLKHNIGFTKLTLSDDVLKDIDRVYRRHPIPF